MLFPNRHRTSSSFIFFITSILATAVSISCGAELSEDRTPTAVTKARQLIDVGQCTTAETNLNTYISDHPDSIPAFMALGDSHTCLAFQGKGRRDKERLGKALRAYESAEQVLGKNDVRVLLSKAIINVLLKDNRAAQSDLDKVLRIDLGNPMALNLSAMIKRSIRVLDDASQYKRTPTMLKILGNRELCPEGATCGDAVLFVEAEADGRRYPAGAILDYARLEGDKVFFEDHIHPDVGKKRGIILAKMPRALAGGVWRRGGDISSVCVLKKKLSPNTHIGMHDYVHRYASDKGRETSLERELGCVPGVVPGSVKANGRIVDQKVSGYPFGYQPVTYQQETYHERSLPLSDSLAFVKRSAPRKAVKAIALAKHLSHDEKRALLRGYIFPGAPLAYANLVQKYRLRDASVMLSNGKVKLIFMAAGGEDVFEDGENVSSATVLRPFAGEH